MSGLRNRLVADCDLRLSRQSGEIIAVAGTFGHLVFKRPPNSEHAKGGKGQVFAIRQSVSSSQNGFDATQTENFSNQGSSRYNQAVGMLVELLGFTTWPCW
jgi:hypothetical protein